MTSPKMKVALISAMITAFIAVLITIFMEHSLIRAILIGLTIFIVSIVTSKLLNYKAQNTNNKRLNDYFGDKD